MEIKENFMFLSIVIPVFNEEESLPVLMEQIQKVCTENHYEKEVIFVDDGSRDSSWDVISRLAEEYPEVKAIRFRRNFGKDAGLEAGFQAASGDFIITMDADLQDDPAEIPNFLAKLEEGFDVVSGWKKVRHDPWHKVYPSRVFNKMVSKLSKVPLHDHNCGMKCYRAAVAHELPIFGERHRFLPVLAGSRGWRVSEIVVQHRKREFGHSKYGFSRFMKGFMDLFSVWFVTVYGQRPQHLLGVYGTFLCVFSFLAFLLSGIGMGAHVCYWKYFAETDPALWSQILFCVGIGVFCLAMIGMLLGGMAFLIGMAAELLTAFHQQPNAKNFAVSEKIRV